MVQRMVDVLPELYEADETAWLEAMSELIKQGRTADLDFPHLEEYLTDMAKRDRREVKSRLTVLLAHLLKWEHQPEKCSKSWLRTILVQQRELTGAAETGILRSHAEAVLSDAYRAAVKQAELETELPAATFPKKCPYSFEQLLAVEVTEL